MFSAPGFEAFAYRIVSCLHKVNVSCTLWIYDHIMRNGRLSLQHFIHRWLILAASVLSVHRIKVTALLFLLGEQQTQALALH
jgi:hypothetical protein